MKLKTSILAIAVMVGGAFAQNPDAIDNARSVAKSLQQKQAIDTNAALAAAGVPAKPAPGQAAQKMAVTPASAPAPNSQSAAKPAMKTADEGKRFPAKVAVTSQPQNKVKIAAHEAKPASRPDLASNANKSTDATKQDKVEDKKWAMSGKRDPFFSPVVQAAGGSGCSTGKKCLEIGHINLRGVVKSDTGFIAVVTNDLNKAYFLRENDPVFNGYVIRITGDSVVFQENVQDKLGKPFTREVVKRIFTPAV